MKYSDEQLQVEIENAIAEASKSKHSAVSSFSVIGFKEDQGVFVTDNHFNTICHAGMRTNKRDIGDLKAIITFLCKNRGSYIRDVEATRFLDYLLNRSPFKDGYITKDPAEAIHRGIILNIDAYNTIVGVAAIVTRLMWEWPEIYDRWKKLVDMGVHEDMALLGAHIYSGNEGRYVYSGIGDNHKAFYGSNMSTESVVGFVRHQPIPTKTMRERQDSYGSPSRAFGEQHYGENKKYFITEFLKAIPQRQEGWAVLHTTKTLEEFAQYLNGFRDHILLGNEMPNLPKLEEVPVIKGKYLYRGFRVIEDICAKNGFTLKEVREIRAQLRDILDNLDGLEWRKNQNLMDCFIWMETPQGFKYWDQLHTRIVISKRRNAA